ncbi:MAG: hypothetical protein MK211_02140 [Flavobacteriales bacterium]|jgi:hypothetical protein|nr:hypothetical protein [Flavobacteriales bacterium]
MKNKIFMYLFFFAVLFIIFQYMNEKKIFEDQDKKIKTLTEQVTTAEADQEQLTAQVRDLDYFTLLGNDNAMTYLEHRGYEAEEVQTFVTNAIYDQNVLEDGNPLVPYEGMAGPMRINKLKFLNHRWIQADFTDGTYWGEMILEYYFNEQDELEFVVEASLLYPKS